MVDHELLVRHAQAWATSKSRPLDEHVLLDVLHLRDHYDDLDYGVWPHGSAERLLLVTWPAYGDALPDEDRLRDTLDTFWGFLRATGRMGAKSASPAELRKELKRSLPKMTAAYDDPARHSQGRVFRDFGNEIGINLDGAASEEELQERLDRVRDAWNALPQDERIRRMPDASPKGNRGAAHSRMLHDIDPRVAAVPDWTGDEDDDISVRRGDPRRAADDARGSSFVQTCLRLAAWVGEGREATSRGLLRPPVAREAYQFLDLWPWERAYDAMVFARYDRRGADRSELERPEVDVLRAEAALQAWHSAGDCLALDRLWFAMDSAGLVKLRGRRAVRGYPDPASDEEWTTLALALLLGLCVRLGEYAIEPLAGQLLHAAVADEPVHLDAVRAWWDERCPEQLRDLPSLGWQDRLDTMLFHFADCGLWRIDGDSYDLTDLGREFVPVYLGALEDGLFDE